MKILKYSLGIIAILLVGFLLLGVIKPEVSYECEIMVDKPLAESWAVTQDEAKMADWLPGFQRVEHISGTPGMEGAVSDVYFENDGEIMSIRETITNVVPNESISMTFESDFMNMDYTLNMAPADGQTKITTSTVTAGNGMFSRSVMAMFGGSIQDQEEKNLANLKATIEENKKSY